VDWDAVSSTPSVSSEKEKEKEMVVDVVSLVLIWVSFLPWKKVSASYHFPIEYAGLPFFL
jgi:hypothetical protein